MFDFHNYPPEGDIETYEKLEKISPFRKIKVKNLNASDLI
jgi:hypothetical protein